jgi:glycerate-2-kinase
MIRNFQELVENGDERAREICLKVATAGIERVLPEKIIKRHVRIEGNRLIVRTSSYDLRNFRRIFVVGGGKASSTMASVLYEILGDKIERGVIVDTTVREIPKVECVRGTHPIPGEGGMEGAKKIIELLKEADEDDLVICLISGGGSALLPLPVPPITLEEKKKVTDLLLRCGATINEINAVRKHISLIKGGQLARAAYPATVITLLISDVIGDPLDVIASGPTAPDASTFEDAVNVLKKYEIWNEVPNSVRERLEKGLRGEIPETPKEGDEVFRKVNNVILSNNLEALIGAAEKAKELGMNVLVLSSMIEGESREVGIAHAGILREVVKSGIPLKRPAVIISGGETTVTVKGSGKGGRAMEFVLGAIEKMRGVDNIAVLCMGTDGIDGPTDAAGAIADGKSYERAEKMGLSIEEYLKENNSYEFFRKLNDLIFTGPTGTNVSDIRVMVAL